MAKLKAKHLWDLTFVSSPVLSPDGERAVAVHTVVLKAEGEDEAPRYRSNLFLYDLSGGDARQLTFSSHGDSQPRFSPDGGKLAFLAQKRAETKPQLYLLEFSGGEARQLTDEPAGVSAFEWHPDGGRLAFISRGDWRKQDDKATLKRVITRSTYLSDAVGLRPDEAAQIYLYDVTKDKKEQLTELEFDPGELAFAPNGRTLYFTASSSEADERDWKRDLYALRLGSGKLKKLLPEPMSLSAVSPSPDDKQLAFFAPRAPENPASPVGLWLVPSRGGDPELVSGDWDAAPSIGGDSRYGAYPNRAAWSASSQSLVLNVNRGGRSGLCELEPASGELTPLTGGNRAVTSFDHLGETAVLTAETTHEPGELFLWRAGEERQLSRLNARLVKRHGFKAASAAVSFAAEDGTQLSYWRLDPAKPRMDRAVVVQVHGGPHTNYGYGFYFEFQLLAAQGYTVIYGNPRGSSSFGEEFATTIQGRYGSVDAGDVLAMTEHALAQHGDPEAPVHLTGGSYGGFMTNWLVGHTGRFRSAVTQRSICNWLSFYGTSDIGERFSECEQRGTPWADTEKLWSQSPLKYAAEVTTPILILHSEADYRCPIEQAEQWFAALKRLGRAPVKFLRFPQENHELSRSGRPDRRVARLGAILDWFAEHA